MAGKVKKIISGVLILITLLVVMIVCTFLFWLGPTVKMIAEHVGSKALGTPVTISELKINPRDGTFYMSGFEIANHSEFGRTNTAGVVKIDIAIDVSSIFSSTVTVHKVQIDSPHFVYEQNEANDNISEYLRNIEAYLGIDPDNPAKPKPVELEQDESPSGPKFVIIEQVEINDILFSLVNTDDSKLDIQVGLEQLSVSMTNGLINLKNFHVSNPASLTTPYLFTLDRIYVEVDPATIFTETVSILNAEITRPYAYLEQNAETDTVSEFLKTIEEISARKMPTDAESDNVPPPEEEQVATVVHAAETNTPVAVSIPVELHNLRVDDLQIQLLSTVGPAAADAPRLLAGIGAISVSLVDGEILVKAIHIPNLPGYGMPNLLELEQIDVRIDPSTIFSDQVDITEILIDSLRIDLEQTETGGNVMEMQQELMGFVPPTEITDDVSASATPPPAPTDRREPVPLDEQPVVLHSLVVSNFQVTVSAPSLTNAPPGWALDADDLIHLNPFEKISIPFAKKDVDEPDTEEPANTEGPLQFLAFSKLHLKPLEGTLDVSNLTVANPRGFANPHLATLETFRMELDPDSIQDDTLIISEILIDRPRVSYERKIRTDNIRTLQQAIEQIVQLREKQQGSAKPPAEPVTTESESDSPEQKVIIKRLLVTSGLVKAKLSVAPSTPFPLPDIMRTDLGTEEGGASLTTMAADLGSLFYDAILGTVSGATGLAGNALKSAGNLTLGALGLSREEEAAPVDGEATIAADAKPEANEEKPKRKPRNLLRRRRPGRSF